MKEQSSIFLERILKRNQNRWWKNRVKEVNHADSLEAALKEELSDVPDYRGTGRQLFFFSTSSRSTIDGRFDSLGVEEKFLPLKLNDSLIDGAIHRGVVWAIGNPQALETPLESVTVYLVKTEQGPMKPEVVDQYCPVLLSLSKFGIHVVFVNNKTGEHWSLVDHDISQPLPNWLSSKRSPDVWELQLEQVTNSNQRALEILTDADQLSRLESTSKTIPGMGSGAKAWYRSFVVDDSCKVAVVENGDEWRVIEYGLLLRANGYDAVKSSYNRQLHKTESRRSKVLNTAGYGVEKRIADAMRARYSVLLDWETEI